MGDRVAEPIQQLPDWNLPSLAARVGKADRSALSGKELDSLGGGMG